MAENIVINSTPVITWSTGGYGSGTSRQVFIDGKYYGTEQIPESYSGRDDAYIQSRYPQYKTQEQLKAQSTPVLPQKETMPFTTPQIPSKETMPNIFPSLTPQIPSKETMPFSIPQIPSKETMPGIPNILPPKETMPIIPDPYIEQMTLVSKPTTPVNVMTWTGSGYGSGTSRTLYADGKYYGTMQIPESYAGRDEAYIQSQVSKFGYQTPSQVTAQQQATALAAEQARASAERAYFAAHDIQQANLLSGFQGAVASGEIRSISTSGLPIGVEAFKASEKASVLEKSLTQISNPAPVGVEAMKVAETANYQARQIIADIKTEQNINPIGIEAFKLSEKSPAQIDFGKVSQSNIDKLVASGLVKLSVPTPIASDPVSSPIVSSSPFPGLGTYQELNPIVKGNEAINASLTKQNQINLENFVFSQPYSKSTQDMITEAQARSAQKKFDDMSDTEKFLTSISGFEVAAKTLEHGVIKAEQPFFSRPELVESSKNELNLTLSKKSKEYKDLTPTESALKFALESPVTMFIPVGAAWKTGATLGKYGLGRAAYILGEQTITNPKAYLTGAKFLGFGAEKMGGLELKNLVETGIQTAAKSKYGIEKTVSSILTHEIPLNPFLATAKYGETVVGAYIGYDMFKDVKTPEEAIGKIGVLAISAPGFKFGEKIPTKAYEFGGKAIGLISEKVITQPHIPYKSGAQVVDELFNQPTIEVSTTYAGKPESVTKVRSPGEIKDVSMGEGKGKFATTETAGINEIGGYFQNKFEIGSSGMQKGIDIMTVRTSSFIPESMKKEIITGIAEGRKFKPEFVKKYHELVNAEAERTGQPIATIPPKTFAGIKGKESESEVFVTYPKSMIKEKLVGGMKETKTKSVPTNKVDKFGNKIYTDVILSTGKTIPMRESLVDIGSSKFSGLTEKGATVRKISYGEQPKVSTGILDNLTSLESTLSENQAFNLENISGKKWLEMVKSKAERKRLEETGKATTIPGTYGQHGIKHATQVQRNMEAHGAALPEEIRAAAQLHDIGKVGELETLPFEHAKASEMLIKRDMLNLDIFPELKTLTKEKRMEVATDIGQHTEIKPFKLGAIIESPVEVVKTIIKKPTERSKSLATADREDFIRFNITPKKSLMFDTKRLLESEQKTKFVDVTRTEKLAKVEKTSYKLPISGYVPSVFGMDTIIKPISYETKPTTSYVTKNTQQYPTQYKQSEQKHIQYISNEVSKYTLPGTKYETPISKPSGYAKKDESKYTPPYDTKYGTPYVAPYVAPYTTPYEKPYEAPTYAPKYEPKYEPKYPNQPVYPRPYLDIYYNGDIKSEIPVDLPFFKDLEKQVSGKKRKYVKKYKPRDSPIFEKGIEKLFANSPVSPIHARKTTQVVRTSTKGKNTKVITLTLSD